MDQHGSKGPGSSEGALRATGDDPGLIAKKFYPLANFLAAERGDLTLLILFYHIINELLTIKVWRRFCEKFLFPLLPSPN